MFYNRLKTYILLLVLTGLFLTIGYLVGGLKGLIVTFCIAMIFNGIMYFFSDKIVLNLFRAKPLDKQKYEFIYEIVKQLCAQMKLPMPKLWIVETPMANAFATGRNPKNGSIAVTSGMINTLDKDELRGVLAHELSHIKNRDVLIATIAATIATATNYMRYQKTNERKNPLTGILTLVAIPLSATLVQLAVSRSREYLADETGSFASMDPLALAAALKKLQKHNMQHKKEGKKYALASSLFIVNPFSAKGLINLLSTHPPMEARIARLQKIAQRMF